MKLTEKKFLFILAAILVVAMGFMAITLGSKSEKTDTGIEEELTEINKQSQSDEISAIESDLNGTDLSNIDKELQDIENELEGLY